MHTALYCLRLFVVVYYLYIVLLELCYVYMPTFIATIAIMGQLGILPEANCCCLQTCSVNAVLLVMCCMCISTFIVTSADISQLRVYLCA